MNTNEHFYIDGRDKEEKPYHYRECGLETVYLANGFVRESYDGEDFVSIDNIDGLWKAIAHSLVIAPRVLDPKEIRFLRGQLDKTQVELAQLLRVDAQTLARWEKGKTDIPGAADLMIRILVLGLPMMQPEGGELLDHIEGFFRDVTGKDEAEASGTVFTSDGGEWHGAIAA